ncbi:MAG: hypothetical protein IH948_00300 [Bacteroidetes bacterium]|nr:hypothetical protein [Bacteroidota bacterium]
MEDKRLIGKRSRAAGARFELKVRKDLESKGWIVSKWMNNVEFVETELKDTITNAQRMFDGSIVHKIGETEIVHGTLITAKHKFRGPGIPMAIGTGFPDFIAYAFYFTGENSEFVKKFKFSEYEPFIIGVEVKSNGYLDKHEKEKCRWLLDNNIFSRILIASKGKKLGEIVYKEYE